jgi:hypothetical protein
MQAEEELQQAAAVVARLTNSSLLPGGNSSTSDSQKAAKAVNSAGTVRPEAISDLKKQVAEANFEALTFQNEERKPSENGSH